jgi:hypothetical protein
MTRWLFALFLGWTLYLGMVVNGDRLQAERDAAEIRECQAKAQANGRPDEAAACRPRYRCGLAATAAAMLGGLWAFVSFLLIVAGAMRISERRHLATSMFPVPCSLGVIDRLCDRALREQVAYVVMAVAAGAAIAVRMPYGAAATLLLLPAVGLALWRYRAVAQLQRAAERPGAICEQRGPGISATDGNVHRRILFRLHAVEAAVRDELPAMRAT